MFRKIHSNRNPKDTLFSEIKNEFGPYFSKVEHQLVYIIKTNPRVIFLGMLVIIFVSLILSFTVFRATDSKTTAPGNPVLISESNKQVQDLASGGFDQILRTGSTLKETIKLKQEIESIMAKKILNVQDSVQLENALIRLEHLNKSLK